MGNNPSNLRSLHMKQLQTKLNELEAAINGLGYNFGSFSLITDQQEFDEAVENMGFEVVNGVKPTSDTHAIIHYDFSTDEMDHDIGRHQPNYDGVKYNEIFNKFYHLHCDAVMDLIRDKYIDEVDGSGNGLFYGGILIKK